MKHVAQNVILDTDIGTDIDDAYAVLLAVSSSELNVQGVTLVYGDVGVRRRIALKLLKLAGRPDIPVVEGEEYPLNRERPIYWGGHEGRGIESSDIEDIPRLDVSAPEFMATAAAEQPGELLLITIGPLTNAAIAIQNHPREMARLQGIVAMASTFAGFGPEKAGVEHNVKCDPEAADIVLGSGIPVLLVGLNVTLQTALTRSHVERIAGGGTPLAGLMAHMTEDWIRVTNRDSTPMNDGLAVAASFQPAIMSTATVRPEVSKEVAGAITYYEAGPESPIRICTSMDVGRFDELFFPRIFGAVE